MIYLQYKTQEKDRKRTMEIENKTFPDNTPYIDFSKISETMNSDPIDITQPITIFWTYENPGEIFLLNLLVDKLRAYNKTHNCLIDLDIPYIPNARMDRVVNEETDVFTLKTFIGMINNMQFNSVTALDVHSNVSEALLNNYNHKQSKHYLECYLTDLLMQSKANTILFPDAGAEKRYGPIIMNIIGNLEDRAIRKRWENALILSAEKVRDWKSGSIKAVRIVGAGLEDENLDLTNHSKILIIDDICSRGGTFYHLIKAFEKHLASKNINIQPEYELYVSHLEPNYFTGDLYNNKMIKTLFTTQSLRWMHLHSIETKLQYSDATSSHHLKFLNE